MSGAEVEAANITCPAQGGIAVIAVTSTAQVVDLSSTGQLGSELRDGHFITMQCSTADVFFNLHSSTGTTVDDTATTGDARAWRLVADQSQDFRLTRDSDGHRVYLHVKTASGSATLRIRISSAMDLSGATTY